MSAGGDCPRREVMDARRGRAPRGRGRRMGFSASRFFNLFVSYRAMTRLCSFVAQWISPDIR